jgi:hypothetical protein
VWESCGRARWNSARTLLEKVKNGLSTYNLVFRAYPNPVPASAGFSNNESLHWYLTTAFRREPDGAMGEVLATENTGPLTEFTEREEKDVLKNGRMSIIDPWGTALVFKYNVQSSDIRRNSSGVQMGAITTTYRPVVYSCGPNKTDDNGLGDDVVPAEY